MDLYGQSTILWHSTRPLEGSNTRCRGFEDILLRTERYNFLTKIDTSMQYYALWLDEESTWYCVFFTPFGKYRLMRLAMGCIQSADYAQAAMEEVFRDLLDRVVVYMDDIKFEDLEWSDHLKMIDEVLRRLHQYGFTVNPLKCEWAVKETDFLGYHLTPNGFKPWSKRVDPILKMAEPTTLTQLRRFIGMVNFYRTMFRKRAHILAPLTSLTKSKHQSFHKLWTEEQTKAFQEVKVMVAQQTLLRYPDLNAEFLIETDASDYQLGAVIKQHGKPIAYYSRKLTKAQMKYPTIEKELLSILELFLWERKIRILCDHKNLSFDTAKSTRVRNWRLLVEGFNPEIEYYPGEKNIEADTLSRHPIIEDVGSQTSQERLHDCLLNYNINQFPAELNTIRQQQQDDMDIVGLLDTDNYTYQTFGGVDLICRGIGEEWKIVLTQELRDDIIEWYHTVLNHPGINRMEQTINKIFYETNMRNSIAEYVSSCDFCQRYKDVGRRQGLLAPQLQVSVPFEEVAVDLIGPWTVDVPNFGTIEFNALTYICTFSTMVEITRIDNKESQYIAMKFENEWLSRYPKPTRVIFDNGGEFIGATFQSMLITNGIKPVPSTSKNPQSNAIIERMHKTIGAMIRIHINETDINNIQEANDLIDTILSSAAYGIRATAHTTMGISPAAIAFGRDMQLNIPIIADLNLLRQRRQAKTDYNFGRENARRTTKDYQVGDRVLIITDRPNKLEERATGPYVIQQVHTNGTVSINRSQGVIERINIRRLKPYQD